MRVLKLLWIILLALGFIGVAQRLMYGHQLAAYGSYVTWGLWVSAYLYFIGLSAGAFLLSSLVYVIKVKPLEKVGKLSLVIALVTLFMALLSIWFDLGHMGRFWRIYVTPSFSSMMAWMVWLYTAYLLLLLAETWLVFRSDITAIAGERAGELRGRVCRLLLFGRTTLSPAQRASDERMVRLLGTVGIPLAIAFNGGVGALFGVVGARPYWHSALYPILFLVSALASGGALLTAATVFLWRQRDDEWRQLVRFLGRATLGLLILYILMEWAEVSIILWGSIPSHVAGFKLMVFGPYWWVFWLVHLGLGVAVPLIMLTARPAVPQVVGGAASLVAVTFLSVRLNIVMPGLAYPELKGLGDAFSHSRLSFAYFPSLHEWLVFMFVLAVGIGLFYAAVNYLPLTRRVISMNRFEERGAS